MNRFEVHLNDETLNILRILAEKDDRKLKNYVEKLLKSHAERAKKKLGSVIEYNTANTR